MERLGFIGLGTMGGAMAANLARAGFPLTVWNRTAAKAEPLRELGARVAGSRRDVGQASDVVITCLTDSPEVEAVLFEDDGLADGLQRGLGPRRLLDDQPRSCS